MSGDEVNSGENIWSLDELVSQIQEWNNDAGLPYSESICGWDVPDVLNFFTDKAGTILHIETFENSVGYESLFTHDFNLLDPKGSFESNRILLAKTLSDRGNSDMPTPFALHSFSNQDFDIYVRFMTSAFSEIQSHRGHIIPVYSTDVAIGDLQRLYRIYEEQDFDVEYLLEDEIEKLIERWDYLVLNDGKTFNKDGRTVHSTTFFGFI